MSSVALSLTADNTALKASLRGIVALHASGYAKVKHQIGNYMTAQISLRFEQQKLWNGQAMKPSKAAAKRGGQTLLDKGNLRTSYNYAVNGTGVELFSGMGYAAAHHFGRAAWTVKPKNGKALKWGNHFAKSARIPELPARPVLGVSEQNLERIGSILVNAITHNVRARGL